MIIENLSENDFFTLIVFNQTSKLLVPRCTLSTKTAADVKRQVEMLSCSGTTNLYDAIKTAYDYIARNESPQTKQEFINRHVVILTDGQPTVDPPDLNDQSSKQSSYTRLMTGKQSSSMEKNTRWFMLLASRTTIWTINSCAQ